MLQPQNKIHPHQNPQETLPQLWAVIGAISRRTNEILAPQLDAVKIQEFINKKIKGLPINPDIVLGIHRFRNMSAKDRPLLSEEKEMRAYREKIEKDSLLFANILKIANSALYGYSGMISTLQRAVFVLGAKTFSEVMFQAVLSKDFWQTDLSIYDIPDIKSFVKKSVAQLDFLESWDDPDVRSMLNDLRTPLFLQEIGKIIFAKIAQENPGIRDHFKTKLRETNTVDLAEHSVFSIDSTDLTERIFEHWKFPRTMINYIRYSKGENAFASLELDSANKGGVILKIIKTLLPVYGAQYGQIEIEEARFLAKKAGLNEAILMTLIEQRMPKAQLPDSANETEIGEL